MLRKPIVAGRFYPADNRLASKELASYIETTIPQDIVPGKILGGIVPHAGWVCSGAVAGKVFQTIKSKHPSIDTFIIFGAVHRYGVDQPVIYPEGKWETPLGQAMIDEELTTQILENSETIAPSYEAHLTEHSIEVQIPFIQYLFPNAQIIPIMVPPNKYAIQAGKEVADAISKSTKNIICIGSTDLTHYGPSYAFVPKGVGQMGIKWAKEVNDAGLIKHILNLDPTSTLEYANKTQSACGAGAIAATISAVKTLGANKSALLEHTTSYEVLSKKYGELGPDSVGYAAIVFGK